MAASFSSTGTRPRLRLRRLLAIALALTLVTVALVAAFVGPAMPSFSVSSSRQTTAAPPVAARSGMVIRRDTGEVLWKRNANAQLPQASCTKIMTALLVLERFRDLDRYVRAPARVRELQKVAIGLRPGDRITVRQALRAMLVKSANDATFTLAVAVAGSEQSFVRHMNRRATQLGLTHTHFVNSRGADKPGHYSSARDLAVLGRYAWRASAVFRSTVDSKTAVISWPPSHRVTVTSHNRILDYEWGDGIKTGATSHAGKVLVGSGTPDGVPLIVVTMKEPTRDREEKDAVALFRWAAALP